MNKFVVIAAAAVLAGAVGSAAADAVDKAASNARWKVAMCNGCHTIPGYRTAYPELYNVPILGGQNKEYLEKALHAYKSGNRKYESMGAIARSLSDEDIAELAAYYASQTPDSRDNSVK